MVDVWFWHVDSVAHLKCEPWPLRLCVNITDCRACLGATGDNGSMSCQTGSHRAVWGLGPENQGYGSQGWAAEPQRSVWPWL